MLCLFHSCLLGSVDDAAGTHLNVLHRITAVIMKTRGLNINSTLKNVKVHFYLRDLFSLTAYLPAPHRAGSV